MAKGKFSNPRPHREEERQIEQAFRQVTKSGKASEYTPAAPVSSMPQLQRQTEPAAPDAVEDVPPIVPVEEVPVAEENAPILPEIPEEALEPTGLFEGLEPEGGENNTPDFLDKLIAFVESNKKGVLVGCCALALVLILAFIGIFFLGSGGDPYNNKILSNVMIAGVNVGGLTKSQATQVVKTNIAPLYESQDMTVRVGSTTLTLTSEDTKAQLDVKAAVNAAYNYGRTGTKAEKQAAYSASFTQEHTIALLPYLELDTEYIESVLSSYTATVGSTLTQASYTLEGTIPDLATDVFDPDTAQPLTLVVTMGTPGIDFQPDALYNAILDAYSLGSFQVVWESTDADALPDVPDMAQVLEEMGKEPVDDSVDLKTFETIPGSYGYTFDVEAAQALVDAAQYGQILRIDMTYVAPERMGEDAFYQDTLGKGRTPYSSNENRVNNMVLACKALDGIIINPGETFSYNDCLGERTTAKGYKTATAYTSSGKTNSLSGGVSQVASTLYYAALTADLEIVERHDHGQAVGYIDKGLDAYVSWKSMDLRFKNNTNFPIKLQAVAENGAVTIQILGTDEKDYYIELISTVTDTYEPETEYEEYPEDNPKGYKDGDVIQEGVTGYFVRTYKAKYDKETGALLSKDFITSTRYLTINEIVVKIQEEETEPSTEETEPEETEAPTPTDPQETIPDYTNPPETDPPAETDPPETTEETTPPTTEAGEEDE